MPRKNAHPALLQLEDIVRKWSRKLGLDERATRATMRRVMDILREDGRLPPAKPARTKRAA